MRFTITDQQGKTVEKSVEERLHKLLECLRKSSKPMQSAMLWTTRNHFSTIYPDSKHYSPSKVQNDQAVDGEKPHASIDIDVAGVTRAYHDLDIRPRFRKALTIPCHRASYGKKAADFQDAFIVRKNDGRAWIAQNQGGQLAFLFKLVKRAFQRQDRRLMPSDETFGQNMSSRIAAYLDRALAS